MLDQDILRASMPLAAGGRTTRLTPRGRLRQIFTATQGEDGKIRRRFEERIRGRIQAGVARCLRHSRKWQAADLAMDRPVVTGEVIPLQLYAQGKINNKRFVEWIRSTDPALESVFCSKDDAGVMKVDIPRLVEVSLGLIPAYVQRRLATQCSRFSQLWPYFRYEARSTSPVARCRADVLTQRVDMIADQYNYRHFFPQTWRHMFMYGRSVVFPVCPWDRKEGWRRKRSNVKRGRGKKGGEVIERETVVLREGIDFHEPHPSRVFYDMSAPLPNVNTDTGPDYIGYWDLKRYKVVREETRYFNREAVLRSSQELHALVGAWPAYFAYYFADDPKVLELPLGIAGDSNVRDVNGSLYTSSEDDQGVFLTQYYERINPKREGICDYPHDVWVWLTVAGDETVIAADWMPSIPAVYGGVNEDDSRDVSASFVHDLMPLQDQASNILSQMFLSMKADLLQIYMIDEDILSEEMRKYIKDTLSGGKYYTEPQALFYSGNSLRKKGMTVEKFIQKIESRISTTVETSLRAVMAVINLADRVLAMSQNEIAQSHSHQLAATEVAEIANTTNVLGGFVSDAIDEQRAGVKRMLYESFISCGQDAVVVPVKRRYERATLQRAGFDPVEAEDEDDERGGTTHHGVMGSKEALVYEYYFGSRDGAERASNAQGAEVLTNLLQAMLQVPDLAAALGKRRLFQIINEVFRLSGAAFDLLLEVDEKETDQLSSQDVIALVKDLEQRVAALQQVAGPAAVGPAQGMPPG